MIFRSVILVSAIALLGTVPASAKPCHHNYAPVCALTPAGTQQGMGNACVARNAGYTILHRGRCVGER